MSVTAMTASGAFQVAATHPGGAASSIVLLAWGDNSLGELGNGSTTYSDAPVAVSLPSGVTPVAVAGGGGGGDPQNSQYAGYALGSDGTVYAWGDNSSGELGNGTTNQSDVPVVVSLPSGVTASAISAGQGTAYAIGSDGNLYAWGQGIYGKLGNGGTTDSDLPVVVSLPSGVSPAAVAAGYDSAYAIGSDGKLYAWGDDFYGELGDGAMVDSATPVVVSLPSGVTPKAIAGGGGAAYTIGSDGNLYAWGYNASGQLGDGSTSNSDTPVVVSLPSGVTAKAVTGGGGFAHAIGSDGKLYGWGLDSTAGQLGDGGSTNQVSPEVITLASGVSPKSITDSLHAGYALGSDGKAYAWGYGLNGELGDGSTANFSPPVVVSLPASSSVLLGPEPGDSAGYAIVNATEVAPSVTTEPTNQTVFAGQGATFTAGGSGFPSPTVQWQVSTDGGGTYSPVTGATNDVYTIASTTAGENGNLYEAVFSNGVLPAATSDPAKLTVNPDIGPSITGQPSNQTDYAGQVASFSAAASGEPPPTVQWMVSEDGGKTWSDIQGNATSTSTTLSGIVYGIFENGWEVEAVFTNSAGSATSNPATLFVPAPVAPNVTIQPTNQTDAAGQVASFSAAASGEPPPTVQWMVSEDGGKTWSDIQGNATSTSTTLSGIVYGTFENGWEVEAVFTNSAGSATSNPATLFVP